MSTCRSYMVYFNSAYFAILGIKNTIFFVLFTAPCIIWHNSCKSEENS